MDNTSKDKNSSPLSSWMVSSNGLGPETSPPHSSLCIILACEIPVAFHIISDLFLLFEPSVKMFTLLPVVGRR